MKNIAIRENHLYNKAYRKGKSYIGRFVAVYVLRDLAAARLANANPEKRRVNRVGLSVSKKIGGAVVRNRTKRIIRAAYDAVKADIKTGNLIVISARVASVGKKSTDIALELKKAFAHLEMFLQKDGSDSDVQNKEN